MAQVSLLLAGLRENVTGTTINWLCGCGMDAVAKVVRSIKAGEAVLLQTPGRVVVGGGVLSLQAATANRPATKVAWAFMSRPPTLCTCPFLTIAIAS